MNVKIHELASAELNEAIEWYELQLKGLGQKFKKSLTDQLDKIKKNPTWYLIESGSIYKAYIPHFPYKLLFTIEKNKSIIIWAIAHMHRKPWYWQSRMKP